jgi:hypothetical protein
MSGALAPKWMEPIMWHQFVTRLPLLMNLKKKSDVKIAAQRMRRRTNSAGTVVLGFLHDE